jgi:arylsulfatase A-like enzyme
MDLDETTIAQVFKSAGYATAAFGKWHNGGQFPYHPNARGFDEFYGFCSGHWGDYFSPPLDHNGELVRGNGFTADDFTDHALTFIEQHKSGPFFAYVAYNTPHSPMQVPDRWWTKFKDKNLTQRGTKPKQEFAAHTRAALAMCENIDWNVGRLLDRLHKRGIADNTIVVYFCDNGPNGHRWTGGLKGIKGSTDEGGVRSTCLIRWPKSIERGQRVPQIAGAIDLLPTLADLASVPLPPAKPLDGMSLKPLLVGQQNPSDTETAAVRFDERMIFSHWSGKVSVRDARFRLDAAGKLFDLVADPGQRADVSQQHPNAKQRLAAALKNWKRTVLAELPKVDERPFIVGGSEAKPTFLPAADGVPHGTIQRSNQHPNSSFFTNWTSTDDKITWNVEVATSGDYDVELFYTCPSKETGSTVEISFHDKRAVGRITVPNDPPLSGMQHDRVPRGESYVKDFRRMKLGKIRLEKGRGQLALRARDVAGSHVADVQMLRLKKAQ